MAVSKIEVEVCVNSKDILSVRDAVNAAYLGGASYIELCDEMHLGGTTPPREHIMEARMSLHYRKGLMVMIRPRGGDFCYSATEIELMQRQIITAAEEGADGVVMGVLNIDGKVNTKALCLLVKTGKDNGLKTGFHRAVDAAPDPVSALDTIIECGVDRVLTAGIPWGHEGTALDGITILEKMIRTSVGRIDVVISGGINSINVTKILTKIPLDITPLVFHSYSGVQKNGKTDPDLVQELVKAARSLNKEE
ncbi:copper homeostasis protein CutC [candidate division KSB1 bacterium]